MSALGLRNNLLALAIIYAAGAIPYHTWLLKTYIDAIPRSAEEVASIDGAGVATLLFRVVFPLMAPALAVSAILSFIGAWGAHTCQPLPLGRKQDADHLDLLPHV